MLCNIERGLMLSFHALSLLIRVFTRVITYSTVSHQCFIRSTVPGRRPICVFGPLIMLYTLLSFITGCTENQLHRVVLMCFQNSDMWLHWLSKAVLMFKAFDGQLRTISYIADCTGNKIEPLIKNIPQRKITILELALPRIIALDCPH